MVSNKHANIFSWDFLILIKKYVSVFEQSISVIEQSMSNEVRI